MFNLVLIIILEPPFPYIAEMVFLKDSSVYCYTKELDVSKSENSKDNEYPKEALRKFRMGKQKNLFHS